MAATVAPAPAAGGTVASWLSIAVLVVYIAVLVWVALGRPPLRASILHALMTGSQTIARRVGEVGLHAENAYRAHVSPDGTS